MRDGFLGIGGSGSKTDRGQNLGATQGAWNLFNYGLPTGEAQQTAGAASLKQASSSLQPASEYWNRLLTGGRTDYASLSAPAINSTLAAADATKNQAAQFGSGRSGGTVAAQRDAGTATEKQIDDTLNQNMTAGRAAGAQGVTQVAGAQTTIGSVQLQNALQQLGLSDTAIQQILANSNKNYEFDTTNEQQTAASVGAAAAKLAPVVAGWFGL